MIVDIHPRGVYDEDSSSSTVGDDAVFILTFNLSLPLS